MSKEKIFQDDDDMDMQEIGHMGGLRHFSQRTRKGCLSDSAHNDMIT